MDIEGEDSMDVAAHVEAKARLAKEAATALAQILHRRRVRNPQEAR